uniref:NADH-ubiquinone oxidoreductase chain 2 n=1 Tax=Tyrannodoris europaea TaxID=189538 RepID=Q8HKA5_TYREU|nr:NADH dehydrogenase subunit 2 [Tyrannodoris europaea]AAL91054.1 NADH dehydrogenase subunit 2 [Tyrannodoris europaea]
MSSGNLLFFSVLLLGPLVSVSSSNWIICWVGMELSFLGAIPLMLSDSNFLSMSKESVMKYFCIQALGSGLLMLGGVMVYMDLSVFWVFELVFVSGLFMKLGIFPMHFWVPGVTAGLNWFPMFIMLGWQKIAPFAFLINLVESASWLKSTVLVFGGLSALVGSFIGLNQTSVRAMLGSSSIVHSGWSCLGVVSGGLWTYFSIYCLSFIVLMLLFLLGENLLAGFGILSLSGLPPFIMFAGKWMILKGVFFSNFSYIFAILPIVGALLSLFFYLKFFYSFYLSWGSVGQTSNYVVGSSLIFIILSGVLTMFIF